MGSVAKPLVLIGCTPFTGHFLPIRAIAADLVTRGYEVTFVCSNHFRKSVEETGSTFVPIEGYGDWFEGDLEKIFPELRSTEAGPEQMANDLLNCFVKVIPSQHQALQKAMKMLTEKHPGRPIVQACEATFFGSLVVIRDAPVIKPTATLGFGVIPMALSSMDHPPFGPGLPPDSSPEGRERNIAMNKHVEEVAMGKPDTAFRDIVEQLGGKRPDRMIFNAAYHYPDRFLQMCTPSVEYPRSDAPSNIVFAGGLPKGLRNVKTEMPSFWDEVVNNKGDKKIVAVCQGSIANKYSDLTIPTMEAFKDRDDILVVVALGSRGATLPEGTQVPANCRVADYIPFDELLPHCALFVTNGGYGAFQHAISNGIPLVVAGVTEDKMEVSMRIEWTGTGVNLKTGSPTSEAIRDAADEVLKNPKYKKRVLELEAEMATFDPMTVVANAIDELGAGKPLS